MAYPVSLLVVYFDSIACGKGESVEEVVLSSVAIDFGVDSTGDYLF
jgi:hypothetical protein